MTSLDFDIYLTGFDVQTVDLREIFCFGSLPRTGSGSGFSPVGPVSAPHTLFPVCNNTNVPGDGPNYNNPFSDLLIDLLQTWHTGRMSAAGSANPFVDGWAWMSFRDDNVLPLFGDQRAQSWVTTLSDAGVGTGSVGARHGTPLGTGADQCNNDLPIIPDPRVFADGFESGDTSGWSDVFP